jgi:hypothetical protein
MDPTMLASQALALLSPYLAKVGEAAATSLGGEVAKHAQALLDSIRRQFLADHDSFAEQTLDTLMKQPEEPSPKQALQGILASKAQTNAAFKAQLEQLVREAREDPATQQFLVQVYGGRVGEIFQIGSVQTLNVGRGEQPR